MGSRWRKNHRPGIHQAPQTNRAVAHCDWRTEWGPLLRILSLAWRAPRSPGRRREDWKDLISYGSADIEGVGEDALIRGFHLLSQSPTWVPGGRPGSTSPVHLAVYRLFGQVLFSRWHTPTSLSTSPVRSPTATRLVRVTTSMPFKIEWVIRFLIPNNRPFSGARGGADEPKNTDHSRRARVCCTNSKMKTRHTRGTRRRCLGVVLLDVLGTGD